MITAEPGVDDATENRAPTRSSKIRVLGIAVALAIGTVGLLLLCECVTAAARPAPWWFVVVVAVGFGLAERFVFHIEYRREAISFSMSEVPTALALVFMNPLLAIAIRVVVSLVVIAFSSRPAAYKMVFNGSLFAFEVALAFVLVRTVVSPASTSDTWLLLAVGLGATLATLAGSVFVSMAIAAFEGRFVDRLISELRTSVVTAPIGAAVAAVATAPAILRPELVVLSAIPVAAVWLVLLRHGRLDQRHRDLEALHGFTAVVTQSIDLNDIVRATLREALVLLRGDGGLLEVYDGTGKLVTSHSIGVRRIVGPTDRNDKWWAPVFDSDHAVLIEPAKGVVSPSEAARSTHLAVPVRDRGDVIGLLVIADRSGVGEVFDDDHLARANRLAEQLSVGLRNALLHADMERAALTDALTGNLNRTAFDRAVGFELGSMGPGEHAAVIMLDLDRFKDINDTLGHLAGDEALVGFGERVRDLLNPGDLLARFGGDEFAVFVRRSTPGAIRALADAIHAASHIPHTLDGLDTVVTVSVGIGMVDGHDIDAVAISRRADIAMYAAKRQHSGVELYRDELDRHTPERLSLLGDLRDALDEDALQVHYQPKIDITTGTVIGAEALARWHHPVRGWVSPLDFVGLAEETGLIRQLTNRVLTIAIGTARQWMDTGFDLGIAVNLSALDLLDDLLAERIRDRLDEHGFPPDRLTLEITESSLMWDTPRAAATIDRLHQLGVKLSLDDFGTGYSSLSYLRRIPVAELKIDRSFVSNLLLDPQDEVIVRSTIDLGHNLGLRVVAEGIENPPILDRLRQLGCDLGQGYGISRPLAPDLLSRWLATTAYDVPVTSQDSQTRRMVGATPVCA